MMWLAATRKVEQNLKDVLKAAVLIEKTIGPGVMALVLIWRFFLVIKSIVISNAQKYSLLKMTVFTLKPKYACLFKNSLWLTVSKALVRRTLYIRFLLSPDLQMSSLKYQSYMWCELTFWLHKFHKIVTNSGNMR